MTSCLSRPNICNLRSSFAIMQNSRTLPLTTCLGWNIAAAMQIARFSLRTAREEFSWHYHNAIFSLTKLHTRMRETRRHYFSLFLLANSPYNLPSCEYEEMHRKFLWITNSFNGIIPIPFFDKIASPMLVNTVTSGSYIIHHPFN